jgi:hypothetical protein
MINMKNRQTLILTIVLIVLIIASAGFVGYTIFTNKNENQTVSNLKNDSQENGEDATPIVIEEKEPEIFQGNDRPIAVMIDNHTGAWPQAGLNKAYLVYEILVEGGETRLMALFKGQDVDKIGPVRSSRHYFLDYALENDAIYVHFGWSPQAESDIKSLSVNNINGISESSSSFWRASGKSSPHNVVTSTEKILKIAERKGYKTTSEKESVLNYTAEAITLEEGIDATTVNIPHSTQQKVEYKYNEETGKYTRYARNKLQSEWYTGEEVTTKNIIITFCDNYTLNDSENKGRQGLYNIGEFKGYYITNGKAIEITCIKSTRTSQTVYKDLNGNEIEVNDGNTFIHICPKSANVKIEPGVQTNIETENQE